jgi:hypothetical protein
MLVWKASALSMIRHPIFLTLFQQIFISDSKSSTYSPKKNRSYNPSGPAQTVEPACQAKADQGFGHIAVTVVLADFGDVFPTLLAGPISLQIVAVGKTQLARERLQDRQRHRDGIIEECTEIGDGGELQGETQAVVFTPAAHDLCQIVIIEVVVAGQLVRRRRSCVTAVVFTLLRGARKLGVGEATVYRILAVAKE